MDQGNEYFNLPGSVRSYKGFDYTMTNGGLYHCTNAPYDADLDGLFTSPTILKALIDRLEMTRGAPHKSLANDIG